MGGGVRGGGELGGNLLNNSPILSEEQITLNLRALVAVQLETHIVPPHIERLRVKVVFVKADGAEHIEVGGLTHPLGEGNELGSGVGSHVDQTGGGHCVVVRADILGADDLEVVGTEINARVGLHEVHEFDGGGGTVLREEVYSVLARLEGGGQGVHGESEGLGEGVGVGVRGEGGFVGGGGEGRGGGGLLVLVGVAEEAEACLGVRWGGRGC